MALLTLNFNENFIYILIYWILDLIYHLLNSLNEKFFEMTKDKVQNEYMLVILLNLSDLLSVFLVLYIRHSFKRPKEKIKFENLLEKENGKIEKENTIKDNFLRNESKSTALIYEQTITPTLQKNFFKKIILIAILDYISRSTSWISYAITKPDPNRICFNLQSNIASTIDTIIRYAFSIYILKFVVYKHRLFAIILITIGFVIVIINDFFLLTYVYFEKNLKTTLSYAAIVAIKSFTLPLEDTMIKQIFLQNHIYPVNMQFDKGIFEFILILIITPILFFSFKLHLEFSSEMVLQVTLAMIFYTLAAFVKAYILLKIIYCYSSQSVSFLLIIQSFAGIMLRLTKIFETNYGTLYSKCLILIVEFIGISMILIAALIYDEIIIINKFRLNENVSSKITYRGELEMRRLGSFDSQISDNQSILSNENNERLTLNNDDIDADNIIEHSSRKMSH